MSILAIEVKLTLQGPILTGATNPGDLGIDSPFARTRANQLYLPGTLIKGKLRQAWEGLQGLAPDLPDEDLVGDWLGEGAGNTKDIEASFDPKRGRVHFSDFVDRESPAKAPVRTRIKMDEDRGSADDGMLQMLESPYASGERAAFAGTLHFFECEAGEGRRFLKAVQLGLSAVPSFGAERGIGFGRLCKVEVTAGAAPTTVASQPVPQVGAALGLILSGDELLCFARRQPAENLFESAEVIPGAAIKGALAQMMKRLGEAQSFPALWSNLSRIRIRHARPAEKGALAKLASAIPLSIVFAGGDWSDVALCKSPRLIRDSTPAFQTDWKGEWGIAGSYFGHCKVGRELRVRTQIDAEKRRALDENLFAYESLDPTDLEWRTVLDLVHVPAERRKAVREELSALLAHGIFGMGKTKARMGASVREEIPPHFASSIAPCDPLVVQVQTPVLLGLPAEWEAARSAAQVHAIYSRAWSELSSGALKLSHYFATQEMAGGLYLHKRFRPTADEYQPWLLTGAGSVFVFEAAAPPATALLDLWLQTGLPIAPSLREHYGLEGDQFDHWERCPFVPENGFGEIAVNLHLNWPKRLLEAAHA
jgi:hypothetical protein